MKILLSEDELRSGVERLASEIASHYGESPLTIIGVLTGSVVLLADLIRLLRMPLRVGVVQCRSYRGKATIPGTLAINADLLPEIRGHRVLLVDDIFDTGQTLEQLLIQFAELSPQSLECAVLLRKRGRQRVALQPTYVGFEIPDEFVVGYGLDYQDAFRNLPYVAALEEHELEPGLFTSPHQPEAQARTNDELASLALRVGVEPPRQGNPGLVNNPGEGPGQ